MINCCILGCNKVTYPGCGVFFHSFPSDPEIKKKWIETTGRQSWKPKKYSRICSLHFDSKSYVASARQPPCLKQDAVPNKYLPSLSEFVLSDQDQDDSSDSTKIKNNLQRIVPVEETGLLQEGYYCNECNNGIASFRYICLQCPDFDLCGACEFGEKHPEHFMLRVPQLRCNDEVTTVLEKLRNELFQGKLDEGTQLDFNEDLPDPLDTETVFVNTGYSDMDYKQTETTQEPDQSENTLKRKYSRCGKFNEHNDTKQLISLKYNTDILEPLEVANDDTKCDIFVHKKIKHLDNLSLPSVHNKGNETDSYFPSNILSNYFESKSNSNLSTSYLPEQKNFLINSLQCTNNDKSIVMTNHFSPLPFLTPTSTLICLKEINLNKKVERPQELGVKIQEIIPMPVTISGNSDPLEKPRSAVRKSPSQALLRKSGNSEERYAISNERSEPQLVLELCQDINQQKIKLNVKRGPSREDPLENR